MRDLLWKRVDYVVYPAPPLIVGLPITLPDFEHDYTIAEDLNLTTLSENVTVRL